MMLDASVIVANLLEEPEAGRIRAALAEEAGLVTTPLAMFEASTRIAIVRAMSVAQAYAVVSTFIDGSQVSIIPIDAAVGRDAHLCASRYHHLTGHAARLNMGDCFAYAAAKSAGLKLAYKGNDFVHTDIDGIRFGA